MDKCRIACVRYLNTVPLIEGLEKVQGVELIPTVPSRIAGMVRSGEAEVGLCSVVDGAGNKGPKGQRAKSPNEEGAGLVMLPVGMIGCDGPTLTVRVFSRVPMERVREVHADTDSHTSVVLCRVVLERLFGVRAGVVDFDARERVERGKGKGPDGKLQMQMKKGRVGVGSGVGFGLAGDGFVDRGQGGDGCAAGVAVSVSAGSGGGVEEVDGVAVCVCGVDVPRGSGGGAGGGRGGGGAGSAAAAQRDAAGLDRGEACAGASVAGGAGAEVSGGVSEV